MSPIMLRQLWTLIETTQAPTLLDLDDSTLVQWLLKQLTSQRTMNHDEAYVCTTYIRSHIPLIRDLAQNRLLASV